MRSSLSILALLAACGGVSEDAAPEAFSSLAPSAAAAPMKSVSTAPSGAWVNDRSTECGAIEEWLVLGERGTLQHVVATHSTCEAASYVRHAGAWSADRDSVLLAFNDGESATRREVTFATVDDQLRLGAFVSVDGGWLRRESIQTGDAVHTTEIALRIDGLRLDEGARCELRAVVTYRSPSGSEVEQLASPCAVEQVDDHWFVSAAELGEDWVLETVDGESFWTATTPSFRATTEAPPQPEEVE